MRRLTGSCLCGAVKIELPDAFEYVGSCHCPACRKSSGAASATAGGIDGKLLTITAGEAMISTYRKSENTEISFCRNCGATLFTRKQDSGRCNVRLGVLDDAPGRQPEFHIFTASKAPWEQIGDGLPQFEAGPGSARLDRAKGYVVIFRAKVATTDREYAETAAQLRTLAMTQYGCTGFDAVTENGREISVSYWPDLASIRAWKADEAHQAAQQLGRERWYESYAVETAELLADSQVRV